MSRTRTTSHRWDIPVERRTLPISGDERRRITADFEAREAARGRGLAPRAEEPERKAPTFDRDVRRWLDKGYSEEMARALAAAGAVVDAHIVARPRKSYRNIGGANPTNV
jgi:hypothetical protein